LTRKTASHDETKSNLERLKHEIQIIRENNRELCKELKGKQKTTRKDDIKLNRALEEAERYRRLLQKQSQDTRHTRRSHTDETEQLKQQNQMLIRQKQQLMQAFKKQMRLIDNLKKQKVFAWALRF